MALLDAARDILDADPGSDAFTMAAVADRAGVTRRGAYLHFASRAELVMALFDHLADTAGLDQSLERVWSAPDAESLLEAWAAHLFRYHPRLLATDRAVRRLAPVVPDVATHRRRVLAAQLANCRRIVTRIVEADRLAETWTPGSATDMLLAMISSDTIETLLGERRWSASRAAQHYGIVLKRALLTQPTR